VRSADPAYRDALARAEGYALEWLGSVNEMNAGPTATIDELLTAFGSPYPSGRRIHDRESIVNHSEAAGAHLDDSPEMRTRSKSPGTFTLLTWTDPATIGTFLTKS